MRISQEKARQAAHKMLEKRTNKLEKERKLLRETVRQEYMKSLPDKINDLWKDSEIREYMRSRSDIYIHGQGFNQKYQSFDLSAPATDSRTWLISKESAEKIKSLQNKIDNEETKIRDLRSDIIDTIIGLGTLKNITEKFPEILPFIPQSQSTGVAVLRIEEIKKEMELS